MTALLELERNLERALSERDLDRVAEARRAIASEHGATDAGAEASYKLGLDALFRGRDLHQAAEHFRAATKAKNEWGPQARISLALVLLRQGKQQQAIFELRKAAGAKPVSVASASASGFLVIALREANQAKEAARAHADHMKLLAKLAESGVPADRATAHVLLGIEHKFDGTRDAARRHLTIALESGALGAEERERVEAALKEL